MRKHPVQKTYVDGNGVKRFRDNAIVRYLIDNGSISLNDIAKLPFDTEDRQQLAQLIGYSVVGYGDLSYVDDEAMDAIEGGIE